MIRAELSRRRLDELVGKFPRARIAVVGDFFLDKYLDVEPSLQEHSIETGKRAHQVVGVRTSPGSAGTVMCNLASLGVGTLMAIGFRGDDGEGYDLSQRLHELGCGTEHLHAVADRHTPTYLKPRNRHDTSLAGEHDRYDTKNWTETSAATERQLLESIGAVLSKVDAVMIMDQVEQANCGVVTDRVRQAIIESARSNPDVNFWADSRRRIHEYTRVMIKPNQFEALGRNLPMPEDQVDQDVLLTEATRLREKVAAPVVITRGSLGMIVSDPEWTEVPGVRISGETDPTGAGDSVSAGTVAALCAGATLAEAAVVGNLVASITIQQLATTGTARPEQLPDRLELWQHQQA